MLASRFKLAWHYALAGRGVFGRISRGVVAVDGPGGAGRQGDMGAFEKPGHIWRGVDLRTSQSAARQWMRVCWRRSRSRNSSFPSGARPAWRTRVDSDEPLQ